MSVFLPSTKEDVAAYIGATFDSSTESWVWEDGSHSMSAEGSSYNNCTSTVGAMCSNEGGDCLQATLHVDPYNDRGETTDYFWRSVSCDTKRQSVCEYICPKIEQTLMYTTDTSYTNSHGKIYVYGIESTSNFSSVQGADYQNEYDLPIIGMLIKNGQKQFQSKKEF